MAINGQNAAAIKALVTGATTTEADFRTGTDHIIDQVDSSAGATVNFQVYNGAGNYTVPASVNELRVSGAGGSGGGGAGGYWNGSRTGGKGGACAIEWRELTVTPGATYAVVLGNGGVGGNSNSANSGNDGSAGNSTTFGNILTLGGGGGGGRGAANGPNNGNAGAQGAITGGSGGFTQNSAGYGYKVFNSTYGDGGNGGNSNTGGNAGSVGTLIIQTGE